MESFSGLDSSDGELRLDYGFRSYARLSSLSGISAEKNLKSEEVVHLENNRLVRSDRTGKDRYFYSAKVEKGIDGDTFWTVINQGCGRETEQKLRLRDINAAEVGKYGSRKATKFLEALLPAGSEILLKTSKSPSHDRFVADVYVAWRDIEGRIREKREKEGLLLQSLDPSSPLLFPLLPSFSSKYVFLNNLLLALGLAKKRIEE